MGVLTTENVRNIKDMSATNYLMNSTYILVFDDVDNFVNKLSLRKLFDFEWVNDEVSMAEIDRNIFNLIKPKIEELITLSATESSLPIGFTYIQFPYMPDPVSMGCAGTWEDISHKFDSTFLRINGGLSVPFEKTITVSKYNLTDDRDIDCYIDLSSGEVNEGDILINSIGERVRVTGVKEVDGKTRANITHLYWGLNPDEKFTGFSQEDTTLLVIQNSAIQNHRHYEFSSDDNETLSGLYRGTKVVDNNASDLLVFGEKSTTEEWMYLKTNDWYDGDFEETRPMNITVKVWQRVS